MRSTPPTTLRHRSRQKPEIADRVSKLTSNSPRKPSRNLRPSQKYFWYTSLKGLPRLALSLPTPTRLPVMQANGYSFNPTKFGRNQSPFALPSNSFWPPKTARDLLLSTDLEEDDCIGATFFNNTPCNDLSCDHNLQNFHIAMAQWQDHYDLQETENRGLGIFTKSSFKKGDVLGWYAGEIVPAEADIMTDYVVQMPVSAPRSPPPSPCMSDVSSYSHSDNEQLHRLSRRRSRSPASKNAEEPQVWIDGNRGGNWTRFINHSCSARAGFQICRVGDIKVMAVRALRNIPKDVELTVNYGSDYYGKYTKRICYCGAASCVGRARHGQEVG